MWIENGFCRKIPGGLKLFHDKFARNIKEHEEYASEFEEAVEHNDQIKNCLHKVCTKPPNSRISKARCYLLRQAVLLLISGQFIT